MWYLIVIVAFVIIFLLIIKKAKLYNEEKRREMKQKEIEEKRALIRKTYTMYWEQLPNIYSSERLQQLLYVGYKYQDLTLVVQRISDNFTGRERKPELLSYSQYRDNGDRHYYRVKKIAELQKLLGNPKWKYSSDGVNINYYDYPIIPNLDLDYLLNRKLRMPWE